MKHIWAKTIYGILSCIGSIALGGCSSDFNDYNNDQTDQYIQLYFTKTETRADLNDDGSGSFAEGDRIGLYIDNGSNIQYRELTLENGEWQPRLSRQEFGPGRLTLSAHYPVEQGVSDIAKDQYAFNVKLDQSGTGRESSDLLVSQAILEQNQCRANLYFRHALHRLRIELTGLTTSADITIQSRTGGTVNLLTGDALVTDDQFQWITPAKNADGSFEAVIYPQDAAPFRDGEGTLLKITTQGKEYTYKAPEKQANGNTLEKFEAGKQITIRLSLKESTVSEWANKKMWVYGITPPEDGEWKQLDPTLFTTYYLAWKKEYGWYDCNKLNPSASPQGVPDGLMCWAASDASLLHWWFDQNKTYIDMYGDKYKGPDYHYPQPKPQESDIFQCYINSFADKPGFADAGLNWFIHGDIPTMPARDYPYNDGGYFKEVFPEGIKLSTNIGGLSKERFNNTIKDALANKKGIAISIGSVLSGHIITLWGAEFDENGEISYIYVADNNDRNQFEIWGVGCMRYEIVYEQYPEGGTYTSYKIGFIPDDKPIVINRIATLELGETYWKQYFGL